MTMIRARWMATVAMTALALAGGARFAGAEDDPVPRPGARIELEFPDLPKNLAGGVSSITAVLPRTYDASGTYPLCLWLGGGSGGDGNPRTDLCDSDKYICVGLPLFKEIDERAQKRRAKGKDPGGGISSVHLEYDDAKIIWPAYRKMLDKLASVVPNIARNKGIVAGFSNGAHCIGILMSEEGQEFRGWFGAFVFAEGGYMLDPKGSTLRGCPVVVLAGEKSWGSRTLGGVDGSRAWTGESMAKKVKAKGAKTLYIEMKGVGHDFPREYVPQVKKFLEANGF
jgi:predicted esterase